MASASRYAIPPISANTCTSNSFSFNNHSPPFCLPFLCFGATSKFRIRASSDDSDDCNAEECAPDKEVGKVSVEWLAGEKTKVAGTFPPRKKGWTGYVEKDTAGQTNIYSVEPTVYVAESAISSGNAGTSSDGAENTAAIAGGLALIALASASSILLQVGKNPPQIKTAEYSGPSLSYYISKFKPPEIFPASVPSPSVVDSLVTESQNPTPEIPQVPLETENKVQEPSTSTADNVS